jgi:hypothetical protein
VLSASWPLRKKQHTFKDTPIDWEEIPFAVQHNLMLSGRKREDFIIQESAPPVAIF